MASVKVLLKANQPKKDGTIPVLIRVTIDRRVKYFSTGQAVKVHQFKEGQENWVHHHPDAVLINSAIEKKRSELVSQILKAEVDERRIDIDTISGKKPKGGTVFSVIRLRMNTAEQRNQVAMYDRLHAKLELLKKAWGRDIALADLSKTWVEKYVTYRLSKGMKKITIKKDLSDLSNCLNALEKFEGIDWFKKVRKGITADPSSKEKLTLQNIKELEKVQLTGLLDIARDMWLFSYYTHGMRFENVATFKRVMIKGEVIKYRMNKGKKLREIFVHERLKNIIDKYDSRPFMFPVIKKEITDVWQKKNIIGSANALINAHLKRVAIICGIEVKLSMHIARHTFAYLSLQRGVGYSVLKDALGHSSYAMTEIYLKSLSDEQVNEAVKGLYD